MIKITELMKNRTVLQSKESGIKFLVTKVDIPAGDISLRDPSSHSYTIPKAALSEYFDLSGEPANIEKKTSKLELSYTVDGGDTLVQFFDWESNMITYCASLISKHMAGQKIEIKAFRGPQDLMKILINSLTEGES